MQIDTTVNRWIAIATAIGLCVAVVGYISDADRVLDEAVMTTEEHHTDIDPRFDATNAKLDSLIAQGKASLARSAADSIKTILRDSCARTTGLSDRGLAIIEEQQGYYEAHYGQRMGIGVCHEGEYLTQTEAQLRGLQ